jgi:hypothetical protein
MQTYAPTARKNERHISRSSDHILQLETNRPSAHIDDLSAKLKQPSH